MTLLLVYVISLFARREIYKFLPVYRVLSFRLHGRQVPNKRRNENNNIL